MNGLGAPLDRLAFFQEQLLITPEEVACISPYRDIFLARRDEFAEHIYAMLRGIPETCRIVDLMEVHGGLRRNWRCWYEGLFTDGSSHAFQEFLWSSGMKHVGRNVDQRFIHLAYCKARLFLGEIIEEDIPLEARPGVRTALDKLVDHCLLVATDAFLAGTTRCDREVINGIAHQVRNPLTVIGGFAHQLQRKVPEDDPVQPVVGTMLQEIGRLESMVENVGVYIEIMQREPEFSSCSPGSIVEATLSQLRTRVATEAVELQVGGIPEDRLSSDPYLLEILFYHLLRNAVEAAREAPTPVVRISGEANGPPATVLTLAFENSGRAPRAEEMEHLFTPFYSSHPSGSGFGLPIATLIVCKLRGEIDLAPLPGEGVRVTLDLPVQAA